MNILYVAPYRQNDNWGQASRQYIKALLTKPDIRLTTRPVYYVNQVVDPIDNETIVCENSIYDTYDVVLQKMLPDSLYLGNKTKNIAIINCETGGWGHSKNIILLNRLDGIYVASEQEKKWLQQSGVTTNISVIPQPVDIDLLIANQSSMLKLPTGLDGTFKFYCIVDQLDRSNLDIIIQAFHLAFGESDRVSLIIKSTSNLQREYLQQYINNIKNHLHTNKVYKNELIITEFFDEKNMISLHNSNDCFLSLTSGNNFCIHTLYATAAGKTPMIMTNTGLVDIVNDHNGFLVKSNKTPVLMQQRPLPEEYDLFSGHEFWYKPSVYSLIENMQKVYKMFKHDRKLYIDKQHHSKNILHNYSYHHIGSLLCN